MLNFILNEVTKFREFHLSLIYKGFVYGAMSECYLHTFASDLLGRVTVSPTIIFTRSMPLFESIIYGCFCFLSRHDSVTPPIKSGWIKYFHTRRPA